MRVKLSLKAVDLTVGGFKRRVDEKVKLALADARPKIAALIVDRGAQAIDRKLHSTAARAKAALADPSALTIDEKGVTLTITDQVVVGLERGFPGFDMKPRLLKLARKGAKRGYFDVPFSWLAKELPGAVRRGLHAEARRTGAAQVQARGRTPGASFAREVFLARGKTTTQAVQHQRGMVDNVIRTEHTRGGKFTRSSYSTIRRISANSSPSAWWHPGFRGVNVFRDLMPALRTEFEAILRGSLRAVGFTTR